MAKMKDLCANCGRKYGSHRATNNQCPTLRKPNIWLAKTRFKRMRRPDGTVKE